MARGDEVTITVAMLRRAKRIMDEQEIPRRAFVWAYGDVTCVSNRYPPVKNFSGWDDGGPDETWWDPRWIGDRLPGKW